MNDRTNADVTRTDRRIAADRTSLTWVAGRRHGLILASAPVMSDALRILRHLLAERRRVVGKGDRFYTVDATLWSEDSVETVSVDGTEMSARQAVLRIAKGAGDGLFCKVTSEADAAVVLQAAEYGMLVFAAIEATASDDAIDRFHSFGPTASNTRFLLRAVVHGMSSGGGTDGGLDLTIRRPGPRDLAR